MKKIIKYIVETNVLIVLLLALYLLNPFNIGYLISYLLTLLIFIKSDFIKKNLDLDFILLFLFSISYALFYSLTEASTQGKQFILIYALSPITFYLLGKYLIRNIVSPNTIFIILFSIGSVFSISAVISVFLNFREGGFAQLNRTIPMFWNGEPVSATGMGGYIAFNMCIPALIIVSQGKKGFLFNLVASTLFVISLICAIRLGSRTQLVIFLFTTIISIIYIFPKQSYRQNISLLFLLGACVAVILRNVSFDLDADWLTTFAGRMSGGSAELASGGGRTERWIKSFEYMFSHPLGWNVKEFGYSHNLWLDVLRVSGVIPFLILLIYSVRSFFQIKRTILFKNDNIYLNANILVYGIAIFLLFMVEPIMEGLFPFFIVFCLYKGIINKYYSNLHQW